MITPGEFIIRDKSFQPGRWLYFTEPREIIESAKADEVVEKLRLIEEAVAAGFHAAGFISYEAAPAFDPAFRVLPPSPLPLIWFGVYTAAEAIPVPPASGGHSFRVGEWRASENRREYQEKIERIKHHIAAGETYQVNHTLRLSSSFSGDPYDFWLNLLSTQPESYAAYADTGRFAVCSVSPELFFRLDGLELISRPMKGTGSRGRTPAQDREEISRLENSNKNRAENLMIVDMVRNDMGRIAETGSVLVSSLFDVESHPTILQMTSTVESRTSVPITEIFAALFPCASITGAPKIRTMEIIAGLEGGPRGIYTGALGFISPPRRAQFNVAIRTVQVDRENRVAEYGIGSGITWDSECGEEYSECLAKAELLRAVRPDFELMESLLWEPPTGYFLLDRHLNRLADSAEYFRFPFARHRVAGALSKLSARRPQRPGKVRLRLNKSGGIKLDLTPLDEAKGRRIWSVALAAEPVDPANLYLGHKTTNRRIYEAARAGRPEYDDVILWNNRGEVTEATIANVVVGISEEYFTPPLNCGLLPGIFRSYLLEMGLIREKVITCEELMNCREIYLINSVRRWIPARLEKRECFPTNLNPMPGD